MNTHALHDLLTTKLGLDPDAVGPSFLTMVARRSVAKSGQADLDSFVDAARHGGEAWEILLDQVLVLETWFFRDRATFETLPSLVRHRWRGPGSAPVRLLSWPCSTGEEPYSVAIALSEAGLPREAFTIDAADVSPQAIAAARAGIYGPRSFRGAGPWHRSPYFEHAEGRGHWRVTPAYRSMVEFRRANLVSLHGLAPAARYDVVLCRNVLIYLHAEARARVMRTLGSLLEPGGVLIVGHAEAGIALEHGFRVHGAPEAFAFVSAAPGAEGSKAARAGDGSASPGRRKTPPAAASPRRRGHTPPPASAAPEHALDRVQRLGDAGRTEEAVLACQEYLTHHPASADGHFLLGVLCGALGRNEAAATALRRALYLEPDHAGALVHLAVMHEAGGNSSKAGRMRARAAGAGRSGRMHER